MLILRLASAFFVRFRRLRQSVDILPVNTTLFSAKIDYLINACDMRRMKNFTVERILIITGILFILAGALQPAAAQLSDYERLAFRNDQPSLYVDVFPLPADNGDQIDLTAIFYISNKFLSFRKLNDRSKDAEFFSTSKLNIEVFKSHCGIGCKMSE